MNNEKYNHIQKIRMEFLEGSERLKKCNYNAIRTIADDLYNKHTHFIFELIQNAEDNSYTKSCKLSPYISFKLTKHDPTMTPGSDGALIIENNEIGFISDDVNAICAIGETTKKKEQGYIGEKGIGFKSVFRITDNPHIFSNGYHFSLPIFDEETRLGYIVPQWINTIPDGLSHTETNIILPLTKKDFTYDRIEEMLQDIEPEVILFLSSLKEIKIVTDTGDDLIILKDSSASPKIAVIVEGKKQGKFFSKLDNFLVCTKLYEKPTTIQHEKRGGIVNREVTVAYPLNQNSTAIGKIFAYLPVRTDTNFPFLMNADFILPSSREDIQDIPWNHWLMNCVADTITSKLLPTLKEREFLDIHFLDALAGRLNDLEGEESNLFYPIHTRVCKVLEFEQFLPTHDNTFVSAKNAVLSRSDAVRNILSHQQLGQLLSRPNDELKWLSSEITQDRTPDLRKYIIESLEIEEITPDMFARRISGDFLSIQTDEWFIRFYRFLFGQTALWRNRGVLRTKPILRLQDQTHVKPPQEGSLPTTYLSLDENTNTSLPIVKLEISQDKDACDFLKSLGVQECDLVAEVIERILPKYRDDAVVIPIEEHLHDFAKIKRAYQTDSEKKREQLRNTLRKIPFILAENPDPKRNNYNTPDQFYFGNDDLSIYFEGNSSSKFVNLDVYPSSARSLFTDLGVMDSVRVKRQKADYQGNVIIHRTFGNHKRGLDRFDPSIEVDGLEHALKQPTLEKSIFIWNQIVIPNADCITGIVEKSSKKTYENSSLEEEVSNSFGKLLIDTKWLPDEDGNMHRPSEISIDDLPELFKKDIQLEKKLNMKISVNNMINRVSSEIGISSEILNGIREASSEVIERIASLLQSPSNNSITYVPSYQETPFPVRSVSNPERREELVIAELEDSPDQEYVKEVRSVRTSRDLIDPKTWLTEQYRNEDDQVVCQICKEGMPFKHPRGNYYFEAVEMLRGHFTKEYEAQFLALCPECSPKYKAFVKQVPEAINALKDNIINAENSRDFEVPVKLDDRDASIRFVERHWIDIKAILSFYTQQQSQNVDNSISGVNQHKAYTTESP